MDSYWSFSKTGIEWYSGIFKLPKSVKVRKSSCHFETTWRRNIPSHAVKFLGELKATFPITIMTLTTFGSILNLIYTAVWKFIQLNGNEPCLDVNLTENTVLLPNGQMNQQLPAYCA